jgi:hypothetical protein
MTIFKIKSIYLLYIYVTACLVANVKQPLWSCYSFIKYIETQYLTYLARDLLSEYGPHFEKFGDPCTRASNHLV